MLSLIVPIFNEQKGLPDFLEELNQELENNESEIENVSITKPVKMRTPFQPGPGPNPKPKHYGVILPTKKK